MKNIESTNSKSSLLDSDINFLSGNTVKINIAHRNIEKTSELKYIFTGVAHI